MHWRHAATKAAGAPRRVTENPDSSTLQSLALEKREKSSHIPVNVLLPFNHLSTYQVGITEIFISIYIYLNSNLFLPTTSEMILFVNFSFSKHKC